MDTCANTLQKVLVEKMEEARQNMVKCNTQKYGLINKVPQFVLKQDFLKNTPCDKRSEEDDIPFWAWTPYHLEYIVAYEEHLKLILHYMYQSKWFQGLFG
jgi:hypothetical protein